MNQDSYRLPVNTSSKKRVLYIAHGHPDFAYGGAERAAFHMYQSMKASTVYEPFLLARYENATHKNAGCNLMRHETDEHVSLLPTSGTGYDYFSETFLGSTLDEAEAFHRAFRELLEGLRPHLIHVHHYSQMGIELIAFARTILPNAKIVLTLHEFIPICANRGSMIKTKTRDLCFGASSLKCCSCFPDRTPEAFFLRTQFFKANLAHVDRFIAPSRFLQNRYVEWGLEADRFLQMDNGRPLWPKSTRPPHPTSSPFVVAFFGQIVFHKGVDVFLRAAAEYRRRRTQAREAGDNGIPEIRFAIHGTMKHLHDASLRAVIEDLIEQCSDFVRLHGAYDAQLMPALLRRVDAVVVPSIWWENSPLVIQEAFMAGIPVICSNIGGMAEKVTDRENGLHFVVGDHLDLLDRVLELSESPALYAELVSGIPRLLSDEEMAVLMHELYRELTEPAHLLTIQT